MNKFLAILAAALVICAAGAFITGDCIAAVFAIAGAGLFTIAID
jgi:hypothetical protein